MDIPVSRYATSDLLQHVSVTIPHGYFPTGTDAELVFEVPGVYVSPPLTVPIHDGSLDTYVTFDVVLDAPTQRRIALAVAVNPSLAHWFIRLKSYVRPFARAFQHGLPTGSAKDPNGGSFVQKPRGILIEGGIRTDVTNEARHSPYPLLTTMQCGCGCGCGG